MATDYKRLLSYSDGGSASQLPRTTLASVDVGGTKRLAVLKTTQTWNDRTFVLTPTEEKFFSAVACGTASSHQDTATSTDVFNDATSIISSLRGMWANRSALDWKSGHKALCTYYARAYGPWAIKSYASNTTYASEAMEAGCTHVALKFNPRCFPISNCTAFSAKLRIYCPSSILRDGNGSSVPAFSSSSTNGTRVRYAFLSELPAPSVFDSDDLDSFRFDNITNINDNSSSVIAHEYDIWNINKPQEAYAVSNVYVYTTFRYLPQDNWHYYYSDVNVSANATTALRKLLHSPFWLVLGFRQTATGFQAVPPYSAATLYASRVELVFKATAPDTFNYDPQ